MFAERSRNSINAGGAESALEVGEAHAAAFAYGAHKALMAKKAENAENAKMAENAKFGYKAYNAKFADYAKHAAHISPTFPPKPHELEKEDDGEVLCFISTSYWWKQVYHAIPTNWSENVLLNLPLWENTFENTGRFFIILIKALNDFPRRIVKLLDIFLMILFVVFVGAWIEEWLGMVDLEKSK